MYKEICDYCGEAWPKHKITIKRTPNAEKVRIELCDSCLEDVKEYING